jgi:hypothetical protein
MGVQIHAPDRMKVLAVVGGLVSAAWEFGSVGLAIGSAVVWVIGWAMSVSGGKR